MMMVMRVGVATVVVVVMVMARVEAATPSCEFRKCSECIQAATCVWCSKETLSGSSRCVSKDSEEYGDFKTKCGNDQVDPKSDLTFTENLSGEDVQIKPQRIAVSQRVGETQTFTMTYKHMANYPVDLYYLMDLSQSMSDDKAMLTNLGQELISSMKNITSKFNLGFGVFSDKIVLPYIETVAWKELQKACPLDIECTQPFSFKNVLALTDKTDIFTDKVKNTKTTTNVDFPEGSFDGLMQAMVCKNDIKWRDDGLRLIVVTTDAPFHIAGDGLLGGITEPFDMACHLEDNNYMHSAILDYPSISQIHDMMEQERMSLIFAVTKTQEPVYAHLTQQLPRSYYGRLAGDSSNIVSLLSSRVMEIISKVEVVADVPSELQGHVSVKTKASNCSSMPCSGLTPGNVVNFNISVAVKSCPENKVFWKMPIHIKLDGRKESLIMDLSLLCECECDVKGIILSSPKCYNNGDLKCEVCDCHEGWEGRDCQCESGMDSSGDNIDKSQCLAKNTTDIICSNRGDCVCGQCECNVKEEPKKIYGTYCECTNYLDCEGSNGAICSGKGKCGCNECQCEEGWTGQYCQCNSGSEDNCKTEGLDEICSNNGVCECNKCKCRPPYYGRHCEYCNQGEKNCTGKCEEYQDCVQCLAFKMGPIPTEQCEPKCNNQLEIKKVPSIGDTSGEYCSVTDKDGCRIYFTYKVLDKGVQVWVQENRECPKPVELLYVILGVLAAVVLIGLVCVIVWRVVITIHDKREYTNFIRDKENTKWASENSPLYKSAVTTITNPVFEASAK